MKQKISLKASKVQGRYIAERILKVPDELSELLRRHVVREQSESGVSQNLSNNTFFIAMDKQEKDDNLLYSRPRWAGRDKQKTKDHEFFLKTRMQNYYICNGSECVCVQHIIADP